MTSNPPAPSDGVPIDVDIGEDRIDLTWPDGRWVTAFKEHIIHGYSPFNPAIPPLRIELRSPSALTNPAGEGGVRARAPYPVEERAFHVVRRNLCDGSPEVFVASDRATLSGFPARDRDDAYAMAKSLNAVVRFHVERALAALVADGGEAG